MASLEPYVRIHNASYSPVPGNGREIVIGPVTIDVYRGEFLAFVGPASCGKTILLKMIAGIVPPTDGEIRFAGNGRPAGVVGLVLGNPALLPWRTCLQNVLLPTEIQGRDHAESVHRARRLLAWFGLSNLEERRACALPANTAPAVAICRALILNPSLLLLDEPFRLLDALSRETMLDALQRLRAETRTTAILCSNNIQEAVMLADRVAVLSTRPGRVLETIVIDLSRPRRLDKATTPQVAEYCNRIRTLFRAQGILP